MANVNGLLPEISTDTLPVPPHGAEGVMVREKETGTHALAESLLHDMKHSHVTKAVKMIGMIFLISFFPPDQ
jgi:hypothetical protein